MTLAKEDIEHLKYLLAKSDNDDLDIIKKLLAQRTEIKKNVCVLCGKDIIGVGNNPFPVRTDGVCCDSCHYTRVIPARFGRFK